MNNTLKTAALLGLLSGVLLVVGSALGGRQGLVVAFGFAALMNLGAYWFSDKLVLTMYRAQPVGPEHPLYRLVERLARQARLPMPRVYVIRTDAPNAFATGRSPKHAAVAATAGTPSGLAQALKKIDAAVRAAPLPANPATAHLFIVNPLSARGLTALFSTHPPTDERIARLLVRE